MAQTWNLSALTLAAALAFTPAASADQATEDAALADTLRATQTVIVEKDLPDGKGGTAPFWYVRALGDQTVAEPRFGMIEECMLASPAQAERLHKGDAKFLLQAPVRIWKAEEVWPGSSLSYEQPVVADYEDFRRALKPALREATDAGNQILWDFINTVTDKAIRAAGEEVIAAGKTLMLRDQNLNPYEERDPAKIRQAVEGFIDYRYINMEDVDLGTFQRDIHDDVRWMPLYSLHYYLDYALSPGDKYGVESLFYQLGLDRKFPEFQSRAQTFTQDYASLKQLEMDLSYFTDTLAQIGKLAAEGHTLQEIASRDGYEGAWSLRCTTIDISKMDEAPPAPVPNP